MNGRQAKMLRKLARNERAGEKDVVDRALVARGRKDDTMVQSPQGVRAFYQKLKDRFNMLTRRHASEAKPLPERKRTPAETFRTYDAAAPAVIQKPLEFILNRCATIGEDGKVVDIDQRYFEAQRAAKRGDGATVKRIAAQFAAAA